MRILRLLIVLTLELARAKQVKKLEKERDQLLAEQKKKSKDDRKYLD